MIEYLKNLFRTLGPAELIARELAESHLAKLQGETGVDFAKSIVDYNNAKIKRLELRLADYTKSPEA